MKTACRYAKTACQKEKQPAVKSAATGLTQAACDSVPSALCNFTIHLLCLEQVPASEEIETKASD